MWKFIKTNKELGLELLLKASAYTVIFFGAVTLIGWLTGVQVLVQMIPEYLPMPPINTVFFIGYGLILIVVANNLKRKNYRALVIIVASVFSIYGLLQFTGYFIKSDLTIDYLLFPVREKLGNFPTNRMSPYSGLLFFLCGSGILLKVLGRQRLILLNLTAGVGILVTFAGFVAGEGYMFGTPFLYSGDIIPLSIRTAISFMLLGFGLLAIAGENTVFIRQFIGPSASARLLRISIPMVILIFVFQGILDVIFVHIYKLNEALLLALITLFSVLFSIILIVRVTGGIFQSASKAEIERLKALEELKIANNAKDKLFSVVSHDLRSPFSSILGLTQLLSEHYDDFSEAEKKSFILDIKKTSENAFELLEDLLTWSRTQTDGIKAVASKIDLAEIAAQQVEIHKNAALSKKIDLSTNIPEGTTVYADKDMVKTILLNLIVNAIKFTREDGKITIKAIIKNKEVQIVVSDTGVGIDGPDLVNMFSLNKSHSTLGTSKEKGTGFGLQIAKEFAERNGGRIWVESEPGKGSNFIFSLPSTLISVEK